MEGSTTEAHLDVPRHIKYWQRCLRSFLPTDYTSTDSSRTTLGFFILSALDLLGAGADTEAFPSQRRAEIRNWILKCQHPHGGFCGSPNHRYPDGYYADVGGEGGQEQMDPANLPATFFALMSLSFVGGFEGFRRKQCLAWLKRLQRPDGSFGQLVTNEGSIEGGYDMRNCYVLAAVRWILMGDGELGEDDVNIEALVNHIRSGQTYDGGISESSSHEAHAGYTYCAIASLSFLNRLPTSASSPLDSVGGSGLSPGLTDVNATVHWLVSRQVGYSDEEDAATDEDELPLKDQRDALAGNYNDAPADPGPLPQDEEEFVGFNGRCNKSVDTCYAFWVSASLSMLGEDKTNLVDRPAIRRFLFEQTQHRIGGFGKYPGNPPDIYHSYLGLAALSIMKEPGLKPLDSALCVSKQHREQISQLRGAASVLRRTYWKNGYRYTIGEDDPSLAEKMSSSDTPPKFLTEALEVISKSTKGIAS